MKLHYSILILFTLFFAGCGSPTIQYGSLELVEVKGSVKLDGKPLPNALVTFRSDLLETSSGQTDADGNYTLMLNSQKSGVTPGEKTVIIVTRFGEGSSEGETVTVEKIPDEYNTNSTLKVIVEKKTNQHFDFNLQSK
jgi:glycosidase